MLKCKSTTELYHMLRPHLNVVTKQGLNFQTAMKKVQSYVHSKTGMAVAVGGVTDRVEQLSKLSPPVDSI